MKIRIYAAPAVKGLMKSRITRVSSQMCAQVQYHKALNSHRPYLVNETFTTL